MEYVIRVGGLESDSFVASLNINRGTNIISYIIGSRTNAMLFNTTQDAIACCNQAKTQAPLVVEPAYNNGETLDGVVTSLQSIDSGLSHIAETIRTYS